MSDFTFLLIEVEEWKFIKLDASAIDNLFTVNINGSYGFNGVKNR